MTNQKQPPKPPRGLSRILWRFPIFLYQIGLGKLMGNRFLLLQHTGRISGKMRQAVIEVVRQDVQTGAYIVASGFGEKADWYRNLMKNPKAVIQIGSQRIPVIARRLSLEEASDEMLDYAHRHPGALRSLSGLMGYELEETEAGYRELGRLLPVIRLEPA